MPRGGTRMDNRTHLTHKTAPTPLGAQRLYGSHTVPNTLLAPLAFWHPKAHVTGLAIRVALVYREANIVIDKLAVAGEI